MSLILTLVFWWLGWLVLANFAITGVKPPSYEANLIVIIFVASLLLGGLFGMVKSEKAKRPLGPLDFVNKISKLALVYKVIFSISFPVVCYLFLKSMLFLINNGAAGFRLASTQTNGDGLLLFGSPSWALLYSMIISPSIFFVVHVGVILYLSTLKKYFFWTSVLLGSMNALMTLGRFFFYYYAIIFIVSYFMVSKNFKVKIRLYKLMSLFALVMIFVSFARSSGETSITNIFNQYVVEYHTIGFSLFDSQLSNPDSIMNQNLFLGVATFAGIERYCVLIIRRLDRSVDSLLVQSNLQRNEFVEIGGERSKQYNAYYTILYNLYLDGRHLGVVLGGGGFGFLIAYNFYNWKRNYRFSSLFFAQVFYFSIFFSIFTTPVETLNFTGGIILFILAYKFGIKLKR
ncbi:O-antigen polymerase [Vibrio cholerae]|uniref:O-antigen polymerase n=1 Tax=Vibrio cholerae TaxID=666 RepID=UPI000841CC43|nr:O-antigen polymerase [Vibrio cholerae]